jgi:hypothetical protein
MYTFRVALITFVSKIIKQFRICTVDQICHLKFLWPVKSSELCSHRHLLK